VPWLMNARDRVPGLAALSERLAGFSAKRRLPVWAGAFTPSPRSSRGEGRGEERTKTREGRKFAPSAYVAAPHPAVIAERCSASTGHPLPAKPRGEGEGKDVILLADTFNTYFEPENIDAALRLLTGLGYRVHLTTPGDGTRPLCCGRTFLAAGLVEEARSEARRMLDWAAPFVQRGVPILGLEPSCLFTLKDEFAALLPGPDTEALAGRAMLIEEFLVAEVAAGRIPSSIGRLRGRALLHGHCHQKAFGAMPAVEQALGLIEGLTVETIPSSCCGMAGAFGYGADTHDISLAMAEASLLPAVRKAAADDVILADGFSCRHQIYDGSGRRARHVVSLLADSIEKLEST